MSEPVWIEKSRAVEIHELELQEHGGEGGFLNEAHLEAALARPRTTYGYLPDTTLEELAAALAVGIAKGHPFVDGNKRTACVVSLLFLRLNGIEIVASEDELGDVFVAVADGAMSEADVALWFQENSLPVDE